MARRREVRDTPKTMQTTHITPEERGELRALGQAIRDNRRQQATSTTDLARTLGIAHQHLLDLKRGHYNLSHELLCRLPDALDTTLVELLSHTEAHSPNKS